MQKMWPVITAVAVVLAFFILLTRRPKPVAVVALRPNPDEEPMPRGHREFMGGLASQPALLRSFRTTRKLLDVFFPSRHPFRFRYAAGITVDVPTDYSVLRYNRLRLLAGGKLCATVAYRLLHLPGQYGINALQACAAILSRRHFFREASATCMATLAGHSKSVSSVAFDPTGRLLAIGSSDGTVKVWRMSADGTLLSYLPTCVVGDNGLVLSVAFDPTGRLLAIGSDNVSEGNQSKVWRMSADSILPTYVGEMWHSGRVQSVAFDRTGRLLATTVWRGTDTSVYRRLDDGRWPRSFDKTDIFDGTWNWNSEKVASVSSSFDKTDYTVSSVAFDPARRLLAICGSDRTATVCHTTHYRNEDGVIFMWSSRSVSTLAGLSNSVSSVAFDPTGRLLATGNYGTVKVWLMSADGTLPTCVATLGHNGWVRSVAFDPTGRLLATSSSDGTVKVWH